MRYRVDFGRIFSGFILFILGIVLLALLGFGALVLYFFTFVAGAESAMNFLLFLTIVPALMVVAGIVVMATGVAWWGRGGDGFMSGVAAARAKADRIRFSARVGEVIGAGITLVVFLFLYENQLRGAAFFNSGFGPLEQFLFYAPLFTGVGLALARAAYGRRNGVRPFDSVNSLFLTVSAFWLLSVFPFDFTHFGDMFPVAIQFIFGWLSNDIGRLLFVLAGVGSMINFLYTTVLYESVRRQLVVVHSHL